MLTTKLRPLLAFYINFIIDQLRTEVSANIEIKSIAYAASVKVHCAVDPGQSWKCVGTVLSGRVVLTVAHCIDQCQKNHHKIEVSVGHIQKLQKRVMSEFRIHDDYSKSGPKNDVALLYTKNNYNLGVDVKQVTIQRVFSEGDTAFAIGWEKENSKIKLKFVKHKVWKRENCEKIGDYGGGSFCASSCLETYKHLKGDSGSNLVTEPYSNAPKLIGLVSQRIASQPPVTVYTNASYYLPWIVKNYKSLHEKDLLF